MQRLLDRFLRYVVVDTQSNSSSDHCPSTPGQKVLGELIRQELEVMGLSDIVLDENGYVMAKLKANTQGDIPAIGFIAHLDTAPSAPGAGVKPQVIPCYDGGDIVLNKEQNIILSPADFPALRQCEGKTLVTSDGTTLLGADDKAGIAAILDAIEYLQENPTIPHGDICIAFTPDEEIGRGADRFDTEVFGAKWAYTIDGSSEGELEYENFHAAGAVVTCLGRNVHPGYAKGLMINACHLARKFSDLVPAEETPEMTEGREGFFHLCEMKGNEEEAQLEYIIRDFDKERFEKRKQQLLSIAEQMNSQMDQPRIKVAVQDQYANMREVIDQAPHIVDIARQAMVNAEVTPNEKPIRGGTDGARLSFMGLPTPNIFTGGHNFHGRYEYLCLDTAAKASNIIKEICRITAEKYK